MEEERIRERINNACEYATADRAAKERLLNRIFVSAREKKTGEVWSGLRFSLRTLLVAVAIVMLSAATAFAAYGVGLNSAPPPDEEIGQLNEIIIALQEESAQLQDENAQLNEQVAIIPELQDENTQLQDENAKLNEQVAALDEEAARLQDIIISAIVPEYAPPVSDGTKTVRVEFGSGSTRLLEITLSQFFSTRTMSIKTQLSTRAFLPDYKIWNCGAAFEHPLFENFDRNDFDGFRQAVPFSFKMPGYLPPELSFSSARAGSSGDGNGDNYSMFTTWINLDPEIDHLEMITLNQYVLGKDGSIGFTIDRIPAERVMIGDVEATLIDYHGTISLLWFQDNVVYYLTNGGTGYSNAQTLIAIAESLQ